MGTKKYEIVSKLAEDTIKHITENKDNWISFLHTTSRVYKYSFKEQVLIYAQKPSAIACASMDLWNNTMHCWVNRGSKGIALIDEKKITGLRYVFDVSDVSPLEEIGNLPRLWEMQSEYYENVIKHLESIYGSTDKDDSFVDRVVQISVKIAEEYTSEYLSKLKEFTVGSSLEGLHEKELFWKWCPLLSESIAFATLLRCGVDEKDLYNSFDFSYLKEFDTKQVILAFGSVFSELEKSLLSEIGKAVFLCEKKLAKETDMHYNALKHKSESESITQNLNREEVEDGITVRTDRRLPLSDAEDGRTAGWNNNQIRTIETEISRGTQNADIYSVADARGIERTFAESSGTGRGENGRTRRTDDESRERDRGIESQRSDALGSENEQYPSFSGGDSLKGIDLHLNSERVETDNEELPVFSLLENQDEYEQLNFFLTEAEQINNLTVVENYQDEIRNFEITNPELGVGTLKQKYQWNMDAIKLLFQLEEEKREATREEQDILSKYVGWGGLSEVFDSTKSNWSTQYQELKNILSESEYRSARESTLNAHYTSPIVIQSIYKALDKFGFRKGNILEPAMGIGNFFGLLPKNMKESPLYGVELDSITGRIAKKLYPKANISISGFEETNYENSFFDAVIGNVPFGQYSVYDKKYDKFHFLIHDYFIAKSLDLVRPGGVLALITSKGTMDKQSEDVRKYIAQRAELLGAIRLPNTAFKANAGTEVTSDIIFLKKRDKIANIELDWVHRGVDESGIILNQYFIEHPEMIMGKMEMISGPFGPEAVCMPDNAVSLEKQLENAIIRLDAVIDDNIEYDMSGKIEKDTEKILSAVPDVRNFSYTIVDDKLYYRENSIMKQADFSEKDSDKIKALIEIRNCTYDLIDLQLDDIPEDVIVDKRKELNTLYDRFQQKFGLINSRSTKRIFWDDSGYCLLCSLEKVDEDGNFIGKADMFTKRTIKQNQVVSNVDTASEALMVSLSEKARIDLEYMSELSGKSSEEITKDLNGIIFLNPISEKWETADEYLSGNVREKLQTAKEYTQKDVNYQINVDMLEKVLPKELDASEIEVRLGATWVDPKYINDFMRDVFETPRYLLNTNMIETRYSDCTSEWNIKGKSNDNGNTLVTMTYGTKRANAYKILEDTLNLRDVRIFDIEYEDGKEKRVLNKKETMLASQKQDTIKEAFKEWVFEEPERRKALCDKYNQLFNSIRPREFDGSHLKFVGMSPDITLKPHQLNAVARQLYGGNTLLAHCVGAGKTYEMIAAAMEKKRLGLCQKSLFVVPNHLTEQWASEFLTLYPGAKILAATKKDFEPANRKKFCSRIATGDYDAVIIGHTQFEKIPLSKERQIQNIENQIDEVENSIIDLKSSRGENYTIKQLEKTRKTLNKRLQKLNDSDKKDNVVTFEQLGVDNLLVDESHGYKNLFLYTKMRNVSGIAQTEAQKSSDMFAKCRYLDEITGGKGITFATGTPISNSMVELYTNMRYLQYNTLQKLNLSSFDAWAATFGETQTAIELAPEGTGYRAKTRFAKFFNLPELISLFKEVADIQTADMLKLPIPEVEYKNIVLKPSDIQKDEVKSLADRAEYIRDGKVEPHIDNMLKVTNDGRKLALDQRLLNELLPDTDNSKVAKCVENAFEIWEETKEQKSAQLIFCDLSTPKYDGHFNVYEDVKEKLIKKGVSEEEIAFIHDANTELRKAELFAKVRSGQVRFLLGSTAKMGAGTNVQDRLIALHHLDVPWRPSDIQQQEGRILRQGNKNEKVKIFRYVTEGTFDSYSWQLIENKQKFISQIMTSESPVRSCEDIDEAALSYAEVKALASGNPYIKEKMDLDIQVSRLRLLKANHKSQKYHLEDNIAKTYPKQIAELQEKVQGYRDDIAFYHMHKPKNKDEFSMILNNELYTDKKIAGAKLIEIARNIKENDQFTSVGEYMGFHLLVGYQTLAHSYSIYLKSSLKHYVAMGADEIGNITRINNALEHMSMDLDTTQTKLSNIERQLEIAKIEVEKPFAQEDELNEKSERLAQLNALLNMDVKDEVLFSDTEEIEDVKKSEKQPELNKTVKQSKPRI